MALAMVLPDGRWQYAEVVDFDAASCGDRARDVCAPLLRRIPGTRFVKAADLSHLVIEFIEALGLRLSDEVEVRIPNPTQEMREIFLEAVRLSNRSMVLKAIAVSRERFVEFQRHCGGAEKTDGHALMDAVGSAICEVNREIPTSFHEAPIFHLELLLGSKNAMSYRAWARAQERDWAALHQAAA